MAGNTTGLDAQSMFLQSLNSLGSGFAEGGRDMASAAQNLGAVQLQFGNRQAMQEIEAKSQEIQNSGADEMEKRKQVYQFSQQAMMHMAANGGTREQFAAIQNLVPPVPTSAFDAAAQGQQLGDPRLTKMAHQWVQDDHNFKMQEAAEAAKRQMQLMYAREDEETKKSLAEQDSKAVATIQGNTGSLQTTINNIQSAMTRLGYKPTTTGGLSKVASTDLHGGVVGLGASMLSTIGLNSDDRGQQENDYNTIAQSMVEIDKIGARAFGSVGALKFWTDNKPKAGQKVENQAYNLNQIYRRLKASQDELQNDMQTRLNRSGSRIGMPQQPKKVTAIDNPDKMQNPRTSIVEGYSN